MNECECQECGSIFDGDYFCGGNEICPYCGSDDIVYIGDEMNNSAKITKTEDYK